LDLVLLEQYCPLGLGVSEYSPRPLSWFTKCGREISPSGTSTRIDQSQYPGSHVLVSWVWHLKGVLNGKGRHSILDMSIWYPYVLYDIHIGVCVDHSVTAFQGGSGPGVLRWTERAFDLELSIVMLLLSCDTHVGDCSNVVYTVGWLGLEVSLMHAQGDRPSGQKSAQRVASSPGSFRHRTAVASIVGAMVRLSLHSTNVLQEFQCRHFSHCKFLSPATRNIPT
jgi:hypothetical protein